MHRSLWLSLCLAVLLPVAAWAQQPALQYVRWHAAFEPASEEAGTRTLALTATIAEGWKLYALDTPPPAPALRLSADAPDGITVGDFRQQPPSIEDDPNFGVQVHVFRDEARFEAPVEVGAAAAEDARVPVQIVFTICDIRICLPPTRHMVEASLDATAQASASEPLREAPTGLLGSGALPDFTAGASGDSIAPLPGAEKAEEASTVAPANASENRAGGMGAFLLLAFVAGLAALLTPCVFPMIPMTVSYFTRHSHSRAEALRMAALYGFSIIGTFTGLGLLLALLVGAAGAQRVAADPYVNLFIGVVFVVFGLSLLGLFELRLPAAFVNRIGRQEQRGGALGVLFMGLTLTLVSFSCTVPFVGGLLAATVGGAWFQPAVGMLVFSTTFALPFFLFALFPRALQALPRSGAWMSAVTVTLGFVELAAALKFLAQADILWGWNVLTRPLVIALTIVLFALCGFYLLGKLPLKEEAAPASIGVGRLLAAVLFFGSSLYLLPGLVGAPTGLFDAYLPPKRATDFSLVAAASGGHAERWYEGLSGLEAARLEASVTGQPVFVDFTGYTCTNCRYMETNVFRHPDVQTRFGRDFVLVRLYTDDPREGDALRAYQLEKTGTVALPTYAVFDPEQRRILAQLSGTASVAEFVSFLDSSHGQTLTAASVGGDGEEERGAARLLQDG